MANRERVALGPLWAGLLSAAAACAWVAWLLPFTGPAGTGTAGLPFARTCAGKRAGDWYSPVTAALASVALLGLGTLLFGYERLPLLILLALLCWLQPALRRPGLFALLLVTALYAPMLGVYGLFDPWEPHYGEVAREILARDDWLSLWWAQDRWFWSKPVLLFWMEAWTMGALGVDYAPDANPLHPEWALRLPVLILSLSTLAVLYATLKARFSARAGALGVLVIATMPLFFFASHQAITDLPLVAFSSIALCCLCLAIDEDPERKAPSYEVGPLKLSFQHLVALAIFLVILPQALYLFSRNLSLFDGFRFALQQDVFLYGSAGNVDVPGNPAPRDQSAWVPGLLGQPFLQGTLWLCILAGLARVLKRESRMQRLLMLVFYLACGLAFLSKGLLGIAVPGAVALLYLIASGRWSLLSSGQLLLLPGAFLVAASSLPWYLATYVRHGPRFLERLFVHDHINRLSRGVHGEQGSIAYFLTQLGYSSFPWIALLPLSFLAFHGPAADKQRSTLLLLGAWALTGFVLFSATVTKFHHYILPVLVPAGVLLGLALDRLWGSPVMEDSESGLWEKAESIALLLGTCLLAFVARDLSWVPAAGPQGQERLLHLFVYKYERPFPEHLDYHAVLTGFGVTASLLAAFSVFGRCRAAAARGLCVTALLFCAFCLNVYMPQLADHWSFQRLAERYYEDRPSAEVPLVAWQMNWKGENFYTGNRVFVFAELDNERLLKWMSRNRGRRAYFVFEHHRYGRFKQLMEDRPIRELSSRKDSNKFVLVELEI